VKLLVREHGAGADEKTWLWLHREALVIYFADDPILICLPSKHTFLESNLQKLSCSLVQYIDTILV
jgi:hypothetical protein